MTICYKNHTFIKSVSWKWKKKMDDDDKLHDLNDKETEEIQKAQLIVTEASQFIQDGNLQSSKP